MRGLQSFADARATSAMVEDAIGDLDWRIVSEIATTPPADRTATGGSSLFWTGKRAIDVLLSVIALPIVTAIAMVIVVLNPFFNPGRLLFRQQRMGLDGKPFIAFKFRSMTEVSEIDRGPYDGIESDRITRLGSLLRRCRIDELPQFWNILKGEMSLIGPRPDYYPHAVVYCHDIPDYANRHLVRPGITGLAQVRSGYAECARSVAMKVSDDVTYIANASWTMELRIARDTVGVILSGFGHK